MFYVYELIDPRTKKPFYVGKGQNKRAYDHIKKNKLGKNTENPYKDHVIRQILAENLEPLINYVFWSSDEQIAYDYESELIKKYGRKRYDSNGILTNLCEDNRPPHGHYSDERREKYRKRMLGNKINKGRKQSEEEKSKRAKSLLKAYESGSRVVTEKMRTASSNTHKGKIVSKETRQQMSKSALTSKASWRGKSIVEILGEEKAKQKAEKLSKYPPPNRKSITIDGIIYESIRSASIALGISEYKAKKLHDSQSK